MIQTKDSKRDGYVIITAPNGVKDTRINTIYSEAEVRKADVKYFVEA